ncbi:MAG: hypothetical protein KAI40_02285 [Desulfobacterales bacterium]|nr:hypothetical protein [Desulfobacterales bacterium]
MKAQSKKNLIQSKFSFGVRRARKPFPKEATVLLRENMKQLKESVRRGDAYKKTSSKMFGGKE